MRLYAWTAPGPEPHGPHDSWQTFPVVLHPALHEFKICSLHAVLYAALHDFMWGVHCASVRSQLMKRLAGATHLLVHFLAILCYSLYMKTCKQVDAN